MNMVKIWLAILDEIEINWIYIDDKYIWLINICLLFCCYNYT